MVEHLSEEQRVPSSNLGLGICARVVQLARTTHCQCVGRGFDPRLSLFTHQLMTQLFEENIDDDCELSVETLLQEFGKEAYTNSDLLQTLTIASYKDYLEEGYGYLESVIQAYDKGNRFFHNEAYDICAIGKTWPDFCKHPQDENLVLRSQIVNNIGEKMYLRERFEKFVESNRAVIVGNANSALSSKLNEKERVISS